MAGDVKLPDIKASVKVDSRDVDAGLNRVQASTRNAGKEFTGLQKTASNAMDGLSSSLTSNLGPASGQAKAALDGIGASALASGGLLKTALAGGAVAAGVGIAALAVSGAKVFVDLAGEIRNFQRASGASAEESSRFVAVLDDLGISSEVGAKAIFKLSREIGEGGTKLAQYGVDVARAKDGTADVTGTLLNLADAYTRTNDPGQRAAMVMNTLGKSGQALIPILEQGRVGLEAFFKGAEGGRQIFSQADLDKARQFEIEMDNLGDTFRGLQLESGEVLVPFLTDLAQAGTAVLEFTGSVKNMFGGTGVGEGLSLNPFGELLTSLGILKPKTDEAKDATAELNRVVREEAVNQQEAAAAADEKAAALDRVTNATMSSVSSGVAYQSSLLQVQSATAAVEERTRAYTEAVNTHGAASAQAETAQRQLASANISVEQAAIAAANAAVRLASDQAEAGGAALTAQQKSDTFRHTLISLASQASGPTSAAIMALANEIIGIPNRTVTINADTSRAMAAIASLERRLASVAAGANSTSGPQQFARGLDVGPVRGRPGEAVPVIAHAGEYVVTPEQLADLRQSPAPVSAAATVATTTTTGPPPVVHTTIVLDKRVLAEKMAQGFYEQRRRHS